MASRLSRAWLARATVAAAVLAFPLLGAGSAVAAMGGGSPESTVNRPDFTSATILPGGAGVDFCFDKTIANGGAPFPTPSNFRLGGYRATNLVGANAAAVETAIPPPPGSPPTSCVRATFPSSAGDLSQYTFAQVALGTVLGNGGVSLASDGNQPTDSTALTGSTTHNGTAGFTSGPDLVAVLPDSTTNTITFSMDQNVVQPAAFPSLGGSPLPNPALFHFVTSSGAICSGGSVVGGGGANVTVFFGGAGSCAGAITVTSAVRAGDFNGAVTSANDNANALGFAGPSTNDDNEVVVPNPPNVGNPTGVTAKPDLTDVKLEANQQALDFTFNKTVTPITAADFFADLSNGVEVSGNTATIIATSTTSTTLRVTFPNFATYDEYVVGGSVFGAPGLGAVVENGASTITFNTPGALPLDPPFGNAGAFARGFSSGPDVLSGIGNTTTGVVSALLDQRAFRDNAGPPGMIALIDNTGNLTASALAGSVTEPSQAAGAQMITIQFQPGQVQPVAVTNLAFLPGALISNLGTGSGLACTKGNDCNDQPNVAQVLTITKTSAILKAEHKRATGTRVSAARRRAQLGVAWRAWLSKQAQHHKHHRHHRSIW